MIITVVFHLSRGGWKIYRAYAHEASKQLIPEPTPIKRIDASYLRRDRRVKLRCFWGNGLRDLAVATYAIPYHLSAGHFDAHAGQRERQSVQLIGDMGLRKLRQPDREVRCLKNNEA